MERLKPYPGYRDSGIPWLGKIPKHWGAKRMKYVAPLSYGDSLATGIREDGDVPVFGSNGTVGKHSVANTQAPAIIVGRKGSFGKINFSERPCFAIDTTYFVDRRTANCDLRWLFYGLSLLKLDEVNEDTGVPGLNRDFAHNQWLPDLPLDEQRAMAEFLDRETAKLDALVAKKEQLTALLLERRSALISHAVTKGLNPDAPMQDSGIPWLGKIPKDWQAKPLRFIKARLKNAFVDGPFGSNLKTEHFIDDGEVFVIESEFATRGTLVRDELKTISRAHFETIRRSETKGGDIIIAKIGAYFGLSRILPTLAKPAVVSGNSMKLTVDYREYDVRFIWRALLHLKASGAIDLLAGTTAQPALSLQEMNALNLAIPPRSEQTAITDYLDRETGKIDALIARVRDGIKALSEYRTALISAVVTGRIAVDASASH